MKSLKESLFDKDLANKHVTTFGDVYKLYKVIKDGYWDSSHTFDNSKLKRIKPTEVDYKDIQLSNLDSKMADSFCLPNLLTLIYNFPVLNNYVRGNTVYEDELNEISKKYGKQTELEMYYNPSYGSDRHDFTFGDYGTTKVKPKDNALYKMIHKSPFNKIIKNTADDWDIDNNFDSPEFDYNYNLYLITWFIMSCSDEKQIKQELPNLLTKANRIKTIKDVEKYEDIVNNTFLRYDAWEKALKRVEVEILHSPGNDDVIRMIVIKFYTRRSDYDSVIYMTLNKK